jgi:endonuclease-3
MSIMPVEKIEEIIRPCGLSNNKSRNLHQCAVMLMEEFSGTVPCNMDDLVWLPGIGRKSANVILGNSFNIPGFPVDTHVKRLLNRIGMVKSDSPEAIEAEVNRLVPPELWTNFSHLLIQHGRKVCSSRNPSCSNCALSEICKKTAVKICVKVLNSVSGKSKNFRPGYISFRH